MAVVTPTRQFYIALGLFMGLLAIVGFWPSYFGPLTGGTLAAPAIIHWHAAIFTGWLVLFLAQVTFAATGNLKLHLNLGRIGIGYAVVLIIVGLMTGVVRSRETDGTADTGLFFAATSDMVIFSCFFFLAVAYRKKPEIHRRAMLVAATMLLVAAVGRLWFLSGAPSDIRLYARLLIWPSPVYCAIAYDLIRKRGVHPIYVAGAIAFVLRLVLADPISESGFWAGFTERTLAFWGV